LYPNTPRAPLDGGEGDIEGLGVLDRDDGGERKAGERRGNKQAQMKEMDWPWLW